MPACSSSTTSFGGGYIGFGAGQAQVVFAPPGVVPVLPDMGIDVGPRAGVDAAHAEVMQGGHEVVYGPFDEPSDVRRLAPRQVAPRSSPSAGL